MVSLGIMRASNAGIQMQHSSEFVALFVGGTSGIGKSTMYQLVRSTTKPQIYFVGRNKDAASIIVDELKRINANGRYFFIPSDVTLLREVDAVTEHIKENEQKLNLLFMTATYITFKGRDESTEGLDRKLAAIYYSRMRYIENLLPLLSNASSLNELSRVITVLSPGAEKRIEEEDLELKHSFSATKCMAHGLVMTDLMLQEYAHRNPGTAFLNIFPGWVKTNMTSELASPLKQIVRAFLTVLLTIAPGTTDIDESGERSLYCATSAAYQPASGGAGVPLQFGVAVAKMERDGVYLLNQKGELTGNRAILEEYSKKGLGTKIWEHTLEVFERVEISVR